MSLPDYKTIEALHKKYAPNEKVERLVFGHCQIVTEIAEWCSDNIQEAVNIELLKTAALLHDIGTYVLYDENGTCVNKRLYPQHAILGAKIVADEGIDPEVVSLIETHILLGLSKEEIIEKPWPLPARDYIPTTIEGRLLCYADRFHSKYPTFNSYEWLVESLRQGVPKQAKRFEAWAKEFGVPDVPALAKRHGQPVDAKPTPR